MIRCYLSLPQTAAEGSNLYGLENSNYPVLETYAEGGILEVKIVVSTYHWVRLVFKCSFFVVATVLQPEVLHLHSTVLAYTRVFSGYDDSIFKMYWYVFTWFFIRLIGSIVFASKMHDVQQHRSVRVRAGLSFK